MGKFKVALFDLDGTLIDTEGQYTQLWDRIGESLDQKIDNLAHRIKGRTMTSIFDEFFPSPEMQERLTQMIVAFESQMDFPFFPGALSFLEDIRQHGVKSAVVTSSNQTKLAAVRRKIPNFDALFDRVLTAEDFTASKPAPDCYLLGASVFGALLDECVVFEDALNGLQAGMSSGIFTIGFATGNPRHVIEPYCHHVEDDFRLLSYDRVGELLSLRK